MPDQEVVIIIEPDGSATIEGKGFSGPECKEFTKAIEADLGTVVDVELKPEYRQPKAAARGAGRAR